MARNIQKLVTAFLVMAFCVTMLAIPAYAGNGKDKDNGPTERTEIFPKGEDIDKHEVPFLKQDITVVIGDEEYFFTASGNNWETDRVIELQIENDESVDIQIIDGDGNIYEGALVNHKNSTGNNGNAS